ncbi:hypothetical protein Q7C36_012872 [Tachysurus vachellii]|uniref:TNFR-Cys domain-containing protein n=1 Tax=Tachysurus vachellii TaxID=175792 RepID=A0AA88SS55_TACVA|nr:hypothetical protein Q7C36_012872 [Tachysurus vachellii]
MYICTCARAEYEINGECCPMCQPGSRVFRHCTEFTSTTCKQCVGLTYTDEPNGLANCISCTVCDAGQGLRVKTACTQTSDTVCEPLEGFYCTDEYSVSCRYAEEHTKCSPGQYIKQKGTALKDAECAECADGTYSNGSLQTCKPHSKCEDFGLTEITKGTNSLDAECGKKRPVALIAGVSLVIVLVLAGLLIAIVIMRRKCQLRDGTVRKTRHEPDGCAALCLQDTFTSPKHRKEKCVFKHTDHGASPVEDDHGKHFCDPQEQELTNIRSSVT